MLHVLNNLLAANAAISQFALMPGPTGTTCAAGVCLAEMTEIDSDAYMIPHLVRGGSEQRILEAVSRAGARRGMREFDRYIESHRNGDLSWGEVKITESGGGRSEHLIHIVGLGSGEVLQLCDTLSYVVFAAMEASDKNGFMKIVFPTMFNEETKEFSAERVARIMLSSIYSHWMRDGIDMPKYVLLAVEDEKRYDVFKRVLEDEAPFVSADEGSTAETGSPEEASPGLPEGAIKEVINELSTMALMAFHFAINRSGGSMRKRCEGQPWFKDVKILFTEDGGENVSPVVIREVKAKFDSLS